MGRSHATMPAPSCGTCGEGPAKGFERCPRPTGLERHTELLLRRWADKHEFVDVDVVASDGLG